MREKNRSLVQSLLVCSESSEYILSFVSNFFLDPAIFLFSVLTSFPGFVAVGSSTACLLEGCDVIGCLITTSGAGQLAYTLLSSNEPLSMVRRQCMLSMVRGQCRERRPLSKGTARKIEEEGMLEQCCIVRSSEKSTQRIRMRIWKIELHFKRTALSVCLSVCLCLSSCLPVCFSLSPPPPHLSCFFVYVYFLSVFHLKEHIISLC